MHRYAIDIIRPDGGYWRTVHLTAASAAEAVQLAEAWVRRELRWSRGYTAANPRPDPIMSPFVRRALAGQLPAKAVR